MDDRPPGNRQPGPRSTYLVSLRVEVRARGKPFDFVLQLIGGTHFLPSYLATLSIQLTATAIELGTMALVPRGHPISDLLRALGPPTRCLAMSATNTLYLYDELGLRFWADPNTCLVGELQLVLETQPRAVLPTHPFAGLLSYQGQPLALPVPASRLAQGKWPGFRLNEDYQQYAWSVYELRTPYLRYAAFISRTTDNVEWVSIN